MNNFSTCSEKKAFPYPEVEKKPMLLAQIACLLNIHYMIPSLILRKEIALPLFREKLFHLYWSIWRSEFELRILKTEYNLT